MNRILETYEYNPWDIESKVSTVKDNLVNEQGNHDIYESILGMVDLTSLRITDTPATVMALCKKMDGFHGYFPSIQKPAAICIFSNFANIATKAVKSRDFQIAVVGGGFPYSQCSPEIKIAECSKAVRDGADEVDIVLPHNLFRSKRYEETAHEIGYIKNTIRNINSNAILKVILETGAMSNYEEIATASFLAMEAGADFIKTSTGKMNPATTPEAAYIMCECIAAYHIRTGIKKGFKPAGGLATKNDVLLYYSIAKTVLGEGWINKGLLRFGTSRLANDLLSEISGKETSYF